MKETRKQVQVLIYKVLCKTIKGPRKFTICKWLHINPFEMTRELMKEGAI